MAADSHFEIAVQLEFLDASAKTPFMVDRHVENLWWTLLKFLYDKLLILRIIFPKRKHTIFDFSLEI